jgi:NADH-quinone oxidoreductase E subunit
MPQETNTKHLSEISVKEILRLKDLYPVKKSAVLMVLHVVYDQFGYLKNEALTEAADIIELPLIDLKQAGTFYTMFPQKPTGKYHIQVCRTLSCYLRGAEGLVEFLKEKLNIKMGETTEDGIFSLTEVECLGSCGTSPMMQINDTYYENLTMAKAEKILDDLREEAKNG